MSMKKVALLDDNNPKESITYLPYSMSRLNEYERCPQRFYFKYVEKLPEIQENAGFLGAMIHQAIAKALRGEEWESTLMELKFDDIEEAKIKVLEALKISKGLGAIVGVETKFALTEDGVITKFDGNDAWFRGIIDLLTMNEHGDYEVWDWKTGHSKPTAFQVFTYAWAVEKALHKKVSKVGYVLLTSGEVLEFEVTDEKIRWAEQKIKSLIQRLENDDKFTPKVGSHCAYCSYISMCPLAQQVKAHDIPAIRTDEEAKEVAKEIKVLEDKLKRYKKTLNGYVEERGDLDLGDLIYTVEYSDVLSLPRGTDKKEVARKAWELIQEKGLDPFEYFSIETKKLGKIGFEGLKESKRKSFKFVKKEM
jgi:CRISPR/Cas system-associated exonuclease Cas4 (RecB family)